MLSYSLRFASSVTATVFFDSQSTAIPVPLGVETMTGVLTKRVECNLFGLGMRAL